MDEVKVYDGALSSDEMDMVRGKGLIYILGQIVSVTRDSDLEKRIEELEAQL